MSHNSGDRYRFSYHGDKHRREHIGLEDLVSDPDASSTPRVDASPYDQASTSQQPVVYGNYPQAGYDPVVYPSTVVQPPRPPPGPYQNVQQSGSQYSGPHAAPAQQDSTELKRTRESSSSSGGENKHKHKGKRRHGSENEHQGGQGSRVPRGDPQVPPTPVQNTNRGADTPSMGGYGATVPPQGQGGSRSYSDQVTYQPRNDPFAGHRQSASSSHPGGPGRGNAPQPQPGSSAEGAGRIQEKGVPVQLPGVDWFDPDGISRGQPGGPRPGFAIDNITWRGDILDVDIIKHAKWSDLQIHQLSVIAASFESWDEVKRLGQALPGARSSNAMVSKMKDWPRWTLEQDQELWRMGPPPENGLDVAGEQFCTKWRRSRAEVYGRRRLFARGAPLYANLGNTPSLSKRKD